MLNCECGQEMDETISTADVAVNNQLLNNQQIFLDNQHSYLRGKTVVTLQGTVGGQYYALPAGIDFDRLEEPVYTNVVNVRYPLQYGITQDDYNVFRSDLGVQASPVLRWQRINVASVLQIELWPIPSVAQGIVFTGLLPLTPMVSDSDTCVIDDMALVLFTAAELQARKGMGDAQAKGAKAKAYLDTLKAGFESRYDTFNLAGVTDNWNAMRPRRRPTVAVNASSN